MVRLLRLLTVSFALLAAACATPTTPLTTPDGANVYVIRTKPTPAAVSTSIYIDDTLVAKLPVNGYTAVRLPPGKYRFENKWPIGTGIGLERELDVPAEGRVFFDLGGEFKIIGAGIASPSEFGRVDEQTALGWMSESGRYVPPIGVPSP